MSDYDGSGERVLEWEVGLPTAEDLAPLSQLLIPPELSSAFSITAEPYRSTFDVNRASQNTISSLRRNSQAFSSSNRFNFKSFNEGGGRDSLVVEGNGTDLTLDGSDSRKLRRIENGVGGEEADSALQKENFNEDSSARTLKRPRLVWTPQLHKRFVDVVAHLGIKNVVPKTIMQLMNVEGLTRENVASHLQKYRLYLKRMQGLSDEGPSSSDYLFASSPVPQSLCDSDGSGYGKGNAAVPIPIPYVPQIVPIPVYGGNTAAPGPYQGFESFPYSMALQRDWSANKFDFLTPNNK